MRKQSSSSLPTTNRFLHALSLESRRMLLAESEPVDLAFCKHLYEPDHLPTHAYFMTSGVATMVTPGRKGRLGEAGMIGIEGIVGGLQVLGSLQVPTQCLVCMAGRGLRIPFSRLRIAFDSSEEIRQGILRELEAQVISVTQIAACHQFHGVRENLVRWLLMVHDRATTEEFNFTHEYLAQMIGARRTTITLLFGELRKKGIVSYARGKVQISDRKALEAMSCDCYRILKRVYHN